VRIVPVNNSEPLTRAASRGIGVDRMALDSGRAASVRVRDAGFEECRYDTDCTMTLIQRETQSS
jgi:hypothetical protein